MELGKNPEKYKPELRAPQHWTRLAWASLSTCLAPTALPLALAEISEYYDVSKE